MAENKNTAQEVSDQEEYNRYLMDAPIAEFAEYAGVSIDEAVNRRVEAARHSLDPSDITVNVRLLTQPQGKLIGLALVQYHGFYMDNFKVFNGENGLFLGEPTVRDPKVNAFVKTIRVTGDELRAALNQKALEGYNAAVDKLVARVAEAKSMEVKPPMQKQYADAAKQAVEHNAGRPAPAKDGKTQNAER